MNAKLMNQDVIIEFQLVMTAVKKATQGEVGSAWDWRLSPRDALTIICNAFIFYRDII